MTPYLFALLKTLRNDGLPTESVVLSEKAKTTLIFDRLVNEETENQTPVSIFGDGRNLEMVR